MVVGVEEDDDDVGRVGSLGAEKDVVGRATVVAVVMGADETVDDGNDTVDGSSGCCAGRVLVSTCPGQVVEWMYRSLPRQNTLQYNSC